MEGQKPWPCLTLKRRVNFVLPTVICQNCTLDVSSFKVMRKCHNEYETKIQEALLIKKLTPC